MGSGNSKKFEWKLGKTGIIIVISGLTVLLCASFLIGVGVGKNIDTYPEKIAAMPQQFLALFWRPAKIATQQKMLADKKSQEDQRNLDFAFHNALVNQKTPAMQKPVVEKKPDNIVDNDQIVLSGSEEGIATKNEEADKRKIAAGVKSPGENQNKATETSDGAGGSAFLIQVASLKDKTGADQIHKTVASLGYSSKIVKTEIAGKGTWYRIVATGFETKAQAQAAADKISTKAKVKCIIRPVRGNDNNNQ